ncbi:MAG TPA: BON domain-containing protein [Opitutaceae bacterium]|nr:BON domain-containing protein [Opitutaceae bacterium]
MKIKHLPVLLVLMGSPIALFASAETDRKIEDAAKASYNFRTVLENHVNVRASDGVVTLTGTVGDRDLKVLAEDTVGSLPGVSRVDDQIALDQAPAEHSDGWIAIKLRTQLLVRCLVSAATTTIRVKDGVVTLTGTADNLTQKGLTGEYAKEIDGVKSVKNDLVVNAAPAPAATMGDETDDASITSQLKYLLVTHRATSALKTTVTTTERCVVITGEAATDAEKSLAGELAGSIRGVMAVTNNMTVKE